MACNGDNAKFFEKTFDCCVQLSKVLLNCAARRQADSRKVPPSVVRRTTYRGERYRIKMYASTEG